jgi:hypothetical protein
MANFQNLQKNKRQIIYTSGALILLFIVAGLLLYLDRQRETKLIQQNAELQRIATSNRITTEIEALRSESAAEQFITGISGSNAIRFGNQEPGNAIIIDTLILDQDGFVAVYTSGEGDELGDFLNASPFLRRGVHKIVSIATPTAIQPEQSYIALIHPDVNNDHMLDRDSESALEQANGGIFAIKITLAAEEAEE